MISVVIPTYEQKGQGANMLRELLASIEKQVFYEAEYFEVVISDNSDNDHIRKIALSSKLPIKYYYNPVKGASENINNAINYATYNKVKLMMQDDLFSDPYALQRYCSALDRYEWVISDSYHVNEIGQRTGQRIANYDPANFDSNTIGMPSVIAFRKNDLRFDPRLKTFCDVYFYYQLYQLYGLPHKIQGFNISQRFHNASLSRNQPPTHKKDKNLLISEGKIPGTLPKVVVAVVVYNRYDNISRWLYCWERCNTIGAELVIIFNNDNPPVESYFNEGYAKNVRIIQRPNVGFDIGVFQDVCRGRLNGFPDYDYLLWCTDDTIPMDPDFIQRFVAPLEKRVGLTCMQISNEVTRHVRTTGFCITRQLAERLKFPADPITTVQQCWQFEHRGGQMTLLKQIEKRGLQCIQIAPLDKSPLYDMGFWYRNEPARKVAHLHDRMNEHNKIFPNLVHV